MALPRIWFTGSHCHPRQPRATGIYSRLLPALRAQNVIPPGRYRSFFSPRELLRVVKAACVPPAQTHTGRHLYAPNSIGTALISSRFESRPRVRHVVQGRLDRAAAQRRPGPPNHTVLDADHEQVSVIMAPLYSLHASPMPCAQARRPLVLQSPGPFRIAVCVTR